jgi:hypothetical protein
VLFYMQVGAGRVWGIISVVGPHKDISSDCREEGRVRNAA